MTEINNRKKYGIQDLIDQTKDMNGYVIAAYTDAYVIDDWNPDMKINEKKLLDLRVFSEKKEVRLFRSSIGKGFHLSVLKDDENTEHYDQVQILDIAEAVMDEEAGKVKIDTISSGSYYMPASIDGMKNPGIRIRYYFGKYPGSERAYIKNWRCVGFESVEVITDILKEGSNHGLSV